MQREFAASSATAGQEVAATLIDELEAVMATKDVRRQADVMRRLANLLMTNGTLLTDEHLALFDEITNRLIETLDVTVRAMFGDLLVNLPNAPRNTIQRLAQDDEIAVAGPVLTNVQNIDEQTLVDAAKTKSQDHLLAISRRRAVGEAVTYVLVERGNREVVVRTVTNAGARLSDFGCSTLVSRSKDDAGLAQHIWARSDIPRQHLLQLFSIVSEKVRSELAATDNRKAEMYRVLVSQAAEQIKKQARDHSATYKAAYTLVSAFQQAGELSEERLVAFARSGKFDEVAIALSIKCDVPVELLERTIVHGPPDQLLVLAKAIGLSWETVRVILTHLTPKNLNASELERYSTSFMRLQPKTAKSALQFYRMRARATGFSEHNMGRDTSLVRR